MTTNENETLILTGTASLLLFAVSYCANQILPDFHNVFNGFKTDLPLSTSIVMSSYEFWWFLPAISVILFIGIVRRAGDKNESYYRNIKRIGITGILLAIFISLFSTYAIYAPTM